MKMKHFIIFIFSQQTQTHTSQTQTQFKMSTLKKNMFIPHQLSINSSCKKMIKNIKHPFPEQVLQHFFSS